MAERVTYVERPLPLIGKKIEEDPSPEPQQIEQKPEGGGEDKNGAAVTVNSKPTDSLGKPEASNLILLYDLFFAANLTAFSNIHETTTGERLAAYVGYFVILWFLWLNVMLFDVRFVVDSIVERLLRAVHLGAMVGISVVAPQYNPSQQVKGTFQAFSIILMISRVALAAQYGLAAFREKPESKARKHVLVMAGCNAAAAVVYLGVTFRFTDSTNSRVFVTWYVAGFVEACLIFYLSHRWHDGLEFKGHALPDRMKTATLLILGEGVIVVAEHVSTVVKNVNSWTSETIGVLTATVALIYIIFQIYFDWAWPSNPSKIFDFSEWALYLWTVLHIFFHLALVLVMEGATQFIVWWKIVELMNYVSDRFLEAFNEAEHSTDTSIAKNMAAHLNVTVDEIWQHYPPNLLVTMIHKNKTLEIIAGMDDKLWKNGFSDLDSMKDPMYKNLTENLRALKVTVLNSIYKNFNIEEISDEGWQDHPSTYEEHAFEAASDRFELVYIYVFCLSGAALILMALLHILSRQRGKSTRPQKIVVAVNIVLGMSLMLLASMARYDAHTKFNTTPWIVPSICMVFLTALVLVHATRSYTPVPKRRVVSTADV